MKAMKKVSIIENPATIRLGREPVVIIPLRMWQQIQDVLEDREALASKKFLRKIAKGRKDATAGKLIRPLR
jgi:hypothetical protein